MDVNTATRALGSLSQATRLAAFRLLVGAGHDGLPAGEIARQLEIPHNTLSSHLAILAAAGLVAARRDGRSVIYRINIDGMRSLLAFLLEDCCGGRPELCAPVLEQVTVGCCKPASETPGKKVPQH